MEPVKLTRSLIVSAASFLLLAGGVAYPVECGMASYCCMPEITDNLAFQQGHCGCGCGQFEEPQVPRQNAVTAAVPDTKPLQTEFDFIIENESHLIDGLNSGFIEPEILSCPPPLILDNIYTPLLC